MSEANILIVEDESLIALDIQKQLQNLGYDVLAICSTGEDAISQADALHPDLILMDIRLGSAMDGITAAAHIHAQDDIPIIYLTAYADETTLQRAKTTGPMAYILKPFEERVLDTTIQMSLHRYQTEKKLQASEERYRALFDHAPDAILIVVDGRIALANPASLHLFAANSPADLIGHNITDLISTQCTFNNNQVTQSENTFYRLDGSACIVDCTAIPFTYEGNSATHIVARDITDRKRAEAAEREQRTLNAQLYQQLQQYAANLETHVEQRTAELEQERRRLQTILDTANDGIYLTNARGNLLYINPATKRITGYDNAEIIGRSPHVWRSTETPTQIIEEMEQALTKAEAWHGEVINQRRDGTLYNASISIAPMYGNDSELQGYVCVQRDITHLKDLARLKDEFASRIGHELRTPVTNMKLYLDLLRRKPENMERYLDILRRETNRLHGLVDGFIEISLLHTDTLPIERVPVSCTELMQRLLAKYGPPAENKQIMLQTKTDTALPSVQGDTSFLLKALQKLLDNALNYTPPGGQVTLETAVTHKNNQPWVTCTVRDTGPGISPADLPNLFERFYRGETSSDFTVPGAGLGLAICHEIISKLGGHLTVESKQGQGATFTVWLQPVGVE
ncbi:MAG: PAS domain S-box protein [Anaerolineales bacterium]|nr:PAS domain S-box protein [Anaerolineales bacterium]MCB9005519.1 PAS domain S-box protein [Ardenticatenaceae bacterium]